MAHFHRRRTPPHLVAKRTRVVLSGAGLPHHVTYSEKSDSFAPGKARPWAQTQILESNALYWNLDLAPDGKRFVVSPRQQATGGQKGSVHVTVLLNFFDELRRRVPANK
jgi:hypothetical protein